MSSRESIAMSTEEVGKFLQTRRSAVLATVDGDGAPDATLIMCNVRSGEIIVHPLDELGHLAANEGTSVAIGFEQCPSYYEIQGVSAHGQLEVVGPDEYRLPLDDVMGFDFSKIQRRP